MKIRRVKEKPIEDVEEITFDEVRKQHLEFRKTTEKFIKVNKLLLNIGLFLMVGNTTLAMTMLYKERYYSAAIQIFLVLMMIYTVKGCIKTIVNEECCLAEEKFMFKSIEEMESRANQKASEN